jgi:hypothetical protein
MKICHHCDNPPCCRPDHLFLGTGSDNDKDAFNKGRRTLPTRKARGERQHLAKLTETAVREIRRRYATGSITQTQLAKEFGVGQPRISAALRRETWKHVD